MAHPGVKNTLREAQQQYYWPLMRRDVPNWTKACPHCQAAKITRHNTAPPVMLPPASEKLRDIHLDVVGPLPEVKGMRYLLTALAVGQWPSQWQISLPAPSLIPLSEDGFSIAGCHILLQLIEALIFNRHYSKHS